MTDKPAMSEQEIASLRQNIQLLRSQIKTGRVDSGFLTNQIERVDDLMARKIRNGYQPPWKDVMRGDFPDFFEGYLKLTERQEFVAIGKAEFSQMKRKMSFKIVRVFR